MTGLVIDRHKNYVGHDQAACVSKEETAHRALFPLFQTAQGMRMVSSFMGVADAHAL